MKIMIGGGCDDENSETTEGKIFGLFIQTLASEILSKDMSYIAAI